jgi:hypothetical protein
LRRIKIILKILIMKEILLIRTDNGEKLKNLLNTGGINYLIVYNDILAGENLTEEEI